jgi:hypothetical protein
VPNYVTSVLLQHWLGAHKMYVDAHADLDKYDAELPEMAIDERLEGIVQPG